MIDFSPISFSVDQDPPGSELGVSCRVLHKLGKLTDRRGGRLSPSSLFWVFGGRLGWRGGEVGRSAHEEAVTAHRRGFLFPLPCLFFLHISSSLTFPAHLRLRTMWMDSHNFQACIRLVFELVELVASDDFLLSQKCHLPKR